MLLHRRNGLRGLGGWRTAGCLVREAYLLRHALDLLDRMIPESQNTDLKTDMPNAHPMAEEHLRAAEAVLQKLQQ